MPAVGLRSCDDADVLDAAVAMLGRLMTSEGLEAVAGFQPLVPSALV